MLCLYYPVKMGLAVTLNCEAIFQRTGIQSAEWEVSDTSFRSESSSLYVTLPHHKVSVLFKEQQIEIIIC